MRQPTSQPRLGCFPGRCGRAGWLRRIRDEGAVAVAPAVLSKPLMKRIPADAPGCNAPCSFLMNLLAVLFPLFTAPSFRTFCGLACGFLTQTGKRTK